MTHDLSTKTSMTEWDELRTSSLAWEETKTSMTDWAELSTSSLTGEETTQPLVDGTTGTSEDDYYYTYEVTYEVLPVTFVFIAAVLGVIMNTFALSVMMSFKKLRKHNANLLIINQSLIDLIASLVLLITYIFWLQLGDKLSSDSHFDIFLCHLFMKEQAFWMCFNVSTFNLVAITVERYVLVVFPLWHKAHIERWHVYVAMVIVWVIPYLYSIPDTIFVYVTNNFCLFNYKIRDARFDLIYACVYFVGIFCLPLLIIIYGYSHILVVIVKKRHKTKPADSGTDNKGTPITKSQINITKTAGSVASAFVICLLPGQIYYILWSGFGILKWNDFAYYITLCISLTNLSVNPLIYVLTMKRFQHSLRGACAKYNGVCVKHDTPPQIDTANDTQQA